MKFSGALGAEREVGGQGTQPHQLSSPPGETPGLEGPRLRARAQSPAPPSPSEPLGASLGPAGQLGGRGTGRGEGNPYLATRSQSLVHSLYDGATRVEVGAWVLAALSQLIIIDLEESRDELVEVRDDQAQLLLQGGGVSSTSGSPLRGLHKVL